MWSSLPSNLRTVLGSALLLGIGVAAAAFTLSFFALRDAAQDPALAWGAGHAWLFPIGVDMALIFFEVLLLGASMVRIHDHGQVVQYPRAIPFLLMLVAAAGTVYFNATHVPERSARSPWPSRWPRSWSPSGWRICSRCWPLPPGPPPSTSPPGRWSPTASSAPATCCTASWSATPRPPACTGQQAPPRSCPGSTNNKTPQIPQNGHGELGEATKRQQIEAYLAGLDAGQLATTTRSQVAAELTTRGMPVDETYAGRILGEWRVRHPAAGGARKRGSRTR
jgi:Protein of unknown function (DUF2637)